ncbi:MAG: DNRLRE domain-containing protein, partial [bacterium]
VVAYSDGGSGVDLATLQVLVDGHDVTPNCSVGAQSATCHAPTLAAGNHAVQASLRDHTGNSAQASAAFQLLLGPGPHVVSLQAVGDTYLRKGDANKNFGSEPILRVRESGQQRALVQFDGGSLASTLGGATVVSASLELHVEKNGRNWGKTGRTVDAHRLTAAWTESGATWNCPSDSNATNNNPDCAAKWGGGSFAATPSASVLLTRDLTGWVSYDVTADVAAFATGGPDFGWLLKKTEETKSGWVDYDSREGTPGDGPWLVVVFTTPVNADTTPPVVAITAPGAGSGLASAMPMVTATYSDADSGVDVASIHLTVDGVDRTAGAQIAASGLTFTPAAPLADGAHTVQVSLRDRAGNQAQAAASCTTDTLPPGVTILTPVEGVFLSTPTVLVTGQANDENGVAAVNVNGASVVLAGGQFQGPVSLQEGANTLVVTAIDTAGNQSSATRKITLDFRPPQLLVEFPASGQSTNQAAIRVSGQATDDHGLAGLTIQGQPVTVANGRFETSVPLQPGANAIALRAVDLAGNEAVADLDVRRFTLPDISITSPADLSFLSTTTIDVAGTVSDAGAVMVNGVAAGVSGTSFIARDVPLIEGGNTLTGTATDSNGHVSTASINVVRDLTPPRLAISFPRDGSSLLEPTVAVTGLVNDIVAGTVNDSEVQVTVNGLPAIVSNRSFLVRSV